ncbi:unnamed protein product, partial [Taenia asiatica]|uniref:Small ribosomal subunit protein eS25 n=1 Tax=Taenia asiatica TaxID=60517 RepID=A0A0R3WDQ4_TAEAS
PPKAPAKAPKKDPKASKPKKDGSGKAKKKKWSKGKVRDKLNNMCLFDQATYDKFLKEIPQCRLITPSSVSERLKIRVSLARAALNEMKNQGNGCCEFYNFSTGTLRQISSHHAQQIYVLQAHSVETADLYLVPYEVGHVPKYHRWMQTRELQVLTASEPLSLEEEYEQQKNWLERTDRVTFILLEKSRLPGLGASAPVSIPKVGLPTSHTAATVQGRSVCDAEVEAMVGDVNFYLIPDPESDHDNAFEGEVSVMIAEVSSRGKGLAVQALAGVLLYAEHFFGRSVTAIVAKVSLDNEPSLRFFKNKLGFVERRCNACFNEVELVCPKSEVEESVVMQAASRAIELLKMSGRDWLFRVYPIDDFRSFLFPPEKA